MMSLEDIKIKLGFDPFNPARDNDELSLVIDDHTPSPYSVLTMDELDFLIDEFKKRITEKQALQLDERLISVPCQTKLEQVKD